MPDSPEMLPLAVDLDETLIRADSLHEGLAACIAAGPGSLFRLAGRLGQGKAAFKRAVAARVEFDPRLLPYNEEFLSYIKAQKQAGRRIGLFTAADQTIADAIASHLGVFDVAVVSDGTINLSGANKVAAIRNAFGERFAYAGNGIVDSPIFEAAEQAILVGPVKRLKARLRSEQAVEAAFSEGRPDLPSLAKALRLHHWAKNLLVFVAPILGLPFASVEVFAQTALLFLLMGLLASSAYIFNDLMDLEADRRHPRKRSRPFASGAVAIREGVLLAAALAVAAFSLGLLLPLSVLIILGSYFALTLAYSLGLKRQPVLDVVVLAILFTLRVLAGSLLLPVPPSPWLLTFSMLFFLGLAMVKRYTELDQVSRAGGREVSARGYTGNDLPLLLTAGVASGFGAIVIFMIYVINEHYPREIYSRPDVLWAIMPLILIWTLRLWHLTVHGRMNDDPLVFALSDRISLLLACLAALVLVVAWT